MSREVHVASERGEREAVAAPLAALIGSVTFGSGGLRYRRLGVAGQLGRLHDPVYVLAREGGTLVGACVLDRRRLVVGGRETAGVYRGSLCVRAERTGRGLGRVLAEAARGWIAEEAARRGEGPMLSFGCVERGNAASLAVLEASGARAAGGLAMPMLYRQWPRERCAPVALAPGRDERERELLAVTQSDATVRDVTPSRLPGFALLDERGVRISARVAEAAYAIETMGATTDALVRLLVTPFPMARRRFDPAAFRHLRLVDVAVRAGCEGDWPRFVATLLARHGVHFALTFVDPGSVLATRLRWRGSRASLRVMTRWSSSLPDGPLALAPVDG